MLVAIEFFFLASLVFYGEELGAVLKLEHKFSDQSFARTTFRILMVDDDKNILALLERTLSQYCGYLKMDLDFFKATTLEEAEEIIRNESPSVMILDKDLGARDCGEKINGIDHVPHFLQISPFMHIVILTASSATEDVVRAMKMGAFNFVTKASASEYGCLFEVVKRAHEAAQDKRRAMMAEKKEEASQELSINSLSRVKSFPGTSDQARKIQTNLKLLSKNKEFSVYIHGPFGSGKGLASKALNEMSFSKNSNEVDYLSINLACKSGQSALEEVFGVEEESGSGVIVKKGLIDLIRDGSFVFENVSKAEPDMQVKIIELVENRSFKRINGKVSNRLSNKRILFTDVISVESLSEKTDLLPEFISALFNAMSIEIPSLTQRKSDVKSLIELLVPYVSAKTGIAFEYGDLPNSFVLYLSSKPPQNGVRGLEQALEKLVSYAPRGRDGVPIMASWRKYLDYHHVPKNMKISSTQNTEKRVNLETIERAKFSFFEGDKAFPGLSAAKDLFEERLINEAFSKYGSVSKIAGALKLSKATAWRKIGDLRKKRGLNEESSHER